MMRVIFGLVICAVAVAALVVPRGSRPAAACTGGAGFLDDFVKSEIIVVGDAVRVGDDVNRAPTLTPPTATNTPVATDTPFANTPVASVSAAPFDFIGLGATLSVVRTIAGSPAASIEVDAVARAEAERDVRRMEASVLISDCRPGQFSPRFVLGQRYLLFARRLEAGEPLTVQLYPVDGDAVVVGDPSLTREGLDELAMEPATYAKLFAGVPADVRGGLALVTATRVPLATMIRAVQALRGGASIGPPDTGSAGLAAQRPPLGR